MQLVFISDHEHFIDKRAKNISFIKLSQLSFYCLILCHEFLLLSGNIDFEQKCARFKNTQIRGDPKKCLDAICYRKLSKRSMENSSKFNFTKFRGSKMIEKGLKYLSFKLFCKNSSHMLLHTKQNVQIV